MPTPFVLTGAVFCGGTLTGTTKGAIADIIDLKLPNFNGKEIETTTMASTAQTFIPPVNFDNGHIELDILFNPDISWTNAVDVWTISFPKSPAGAATPATWAFSGFMVEYAPKAPLKDKMTATIKIKVSGAITIVAQA